MAAAHLSGCIDVQDTVFIQSTLRILSSGKPTQGWPMESLRAEPCRERPCMTSVSHSAMTLLFSPCMEVALLGHAVNGRTLLWESMLQKTDTCQDV